MAILIMAIVFLWGRKKTAIYALFYGGTRTSGVEKKGFLVECLTHSASWDCKTMMRSLVVLFAVVLVSVHGLLLAPPRNARQTCLFSTPEEPTSTRESAQRPFVVAGNAAVAAGIAASLQGVMTARAADGALVLKPLPYSPKALEPHISERTLFYHHDKHYSKYVETTLKMTAGTELEGSDLVAIMKKSHGSKPSLFNNAAQSWNHAFYFDCMKPNGGGTPSPNSKIGTAISKSFGSFDDFRTAFASAGNTVFGSGWAWLVESNDGKLEIVKTIGAENPLLDGKQPILTMGR